MSPVALLAAASALAYAPAACAADCLKNGDVVTGRLEWRSLTAPQGKPIPAPFLVLGDAACVDGSQSRAQGVNVQLDFAEADPLSAVREGDTLAVSADYRAPHGKWETGDIMAERAHIVTRP
jgi:hypothetical protein